jgi:hypothetical protein
MAQNKDSRRIEKLEKTLYSRNEPPAREHIGPHYDPEQFVVKTEWQHDHENGVNEDATFSQSSSHSSEDKISSFSRHIFLFSLFFFLVAIGAAFYIYGRGLNVVSSNNIGIDVTGPVSIAAGTELDLDVSLKNENSSDLQLADMRVVYPAGSRNPDDITKSLQRTVDDVGTIPSGKSVTKKIRAILYGQQDSQQPLTIALEYRVKGSNAVFEKDKTINIGISSAPVTVTINSLNEVNSGQDIEFTVDITSNSSQVLQNVMLKADYPFGFSFANAEPSAFFGNNIWKIGDISPGQKATVKVRGKIIGQDGEQRVFHFSAGIQSMTVETDLDPIFLTTDQTVSIKKPFIGISMSLDGDSSPIHSTDAGKIVRATVTWTNNLPTQIYHAIISVKLGGATLDQNTVTNDQGFYSSIDNTITWDERSEPSLALLNPGDTGQVSFNFASLNPQLDSLSIFKNSEMTADVSVKGKRTDDVQVPEELLSAVTQKVRLNTTLALSPRILYSTGPFTNTGPMPPHANEATTYTVILTVTNTLNDVSNAQVTAVLPPYVTWSNVISPSSEDISYEPHGGVVTWNVGSVPAGTGFSSSPRQAAFQISFLPSISQVGSAPVLIGNVTLQGTDIFTNNAVGDSKSSLNTTLSTDINFKSGDEVVRP